MELFNTRWALPRNLTSLLRDVITVILTHLEDEVYDITIIAWPDAMNVSGECGLAFPIRTASTDDKDRRAFVVVM